MIERALVALLGRVLRLLDRVVPGDERDDVVGDVHEMQGRRVARWGPVAATLLTIAEALVQFVRFAVVAGARALFDRSWLISGIEIRLALRLALRQPFLTLTAVAALGLGIGLAAGGASLVHQVFYGALPFDDGDRWVVVETYSGADGRRTRLDLERLQAFRTASAFRYIAGSNSLQINVVHDDGSVERVAGAELTPRTFEFLPYVPTAGRLFTSDDGAPGAEPVALVRESYRRRRLATLDDPVGATIDLAGVRHRIVGVLPDDAGYPSDGEIWVPLPETTLGARADRDPVAGTRQVAILAPGVTSDQATLQLQEISARISEPGSGVAAQRHRLTGITETIVSPQAQLMAALTILVLVVVLAVIAANAANLIVARTSRRGPEIAVRNALGASRARLVAQLFAEVCVIVGLAALPGLALAAGVLRVYDRTLTELPFWIHLGLRPSTVVIVALLALVTAGVMGVVPALRATGPGAGGSLRGAGRSGHLGIGRIGGAMIASEVALSVALLGTAVLFAQGFRSYVDPDFHLPDDRVLTAQVSVARVGNEAAWVGVSADDSLAALARAVEQRLGSIPGVSAVGLGSNLPRSAPYPESIDLEGIGLRVRAPIVEYRPGLLEVLEVGPSIGRTLVAADLDVGAPPVAVVNEAFALEHYGTTQIVGRRIRTVADETEPGSAPLPWREIVGVVPNVMEVMASVSGAGVYVPMPPRGRFAVALRVPSNPASFGGTLRRAIYELDPRLDVTEIVPLDQVGAENRLALGAMSSALIVIATVTLILSLAGVYSIVSLSVSQRTREIGVRVALGAAASSVLFVIVRRSALLIALGGTLGALAGLQVSRLRMFVFPIPHADPWLFPALVALMVAAGVVACWVPARRALSIQPVEALQADG